MPSRMDQQELRRFAQIGAATRLEALDRERAALLAAFPGLRSAGKTTAAWDRNVEPRPRRRRRMSAAARKAVSTRMKKYWADRRKGKRATANA